MRTHTDMNLVRDLYWYDCTRRPAKFQSNTKVRLCETLYVKIKTARCIGMYTKSFYYIEHPLKVNVTIIT